MLGLRGDPAKVMLREQGVLSPDECAALRDAVDAAVLGEGKQQGADTVDGAADYQLNLSLEALAACLGEGGGLARLRRLEQRFAALAGDGTGDGTAAKRSDHGPEEPSALAVADPLAWHLLAAVRGDSRASSEAQDESLTLTRPGEGSQIFIRRYSAGGRPWIPFHCDSARLTLNISLCSEADFDGGELLVAAGGRLRAVVRQEGEATVHASTLLHGVARMAAGPAARYSLIIFVGSATVAG